MGCYSYICNGCGKPICGAEQVHLMHVRHGEVLGHAEGMFNGYGFVVGDTRLQSGEGSPEEEYLVSQEDGLSLL